MPILRAVLASCFAVLAFSGVSVRAQTTDASHAIQVFPVVVDTASFVEKMVFRNPGTESIQVKARYFPAEGTSQATPLDCDTIFLSAEETKSYTGLRSLCPNLAAGSQFGFLYTWNGTAWTNANVPYSAYSRVDNAKGIGFSVEAFPAQSFTAGRTVVTGLRRMAATATAPAYQTNCFLGLLNDVTPDAVPVQTAVSYSLKQWDWEIGVGQVVLTPGRMVRILDIFAAAGVTPGDYDNVVGVFDESGEGEPGVVTFCTVQDNTSFGADFRIGKQSGGISHGSLTDSRVTQDDGALRDSIVASDVRLSTGAGTAAARAFAIPAGASSNAHVLYFRHPDTVACSLEDPATGFQLNTAYGLEMRLMASDGTTVLAGGNDETGFFQLYLGDKRDRDEGVSTRYVLEVESNENNTGVNRPYRLHCRSGSGHGLGELVRVGGPNLF
jgi:hypothetical protein